MTQPCSLAKQLSVRLERSFSCHVLTLRHANRTGGKVSPSRVPFYDALITAITKSTAGPGTTTIETWQLECLRRSLIEQPPSNGEKETAPRHSQRCAAFRRAKAELIAAKWISIEDDSRNRPQREIAIRSQNAGIGGRAREAPRETGRPVRPTAPRPGSASGFRV